MDYEAFKQKVLLLTGINLNFYKERQMKRRIDSLIKKHEYNGYASYFDAINHNKEMCDEFVNYLTINVSEFFRNPAQWTVLENEILPTVLANNSNVKIWSSACSTGDEPYTLAMILSKYMSFNDINILASDIDKEAIEKAKIGRYHKKSIEKLPETFLRKYFSKVDNYYYTISDSIKKCVTFKHLDLLRDDFPTQCDIILCRNVLIYFTEDAKNLVYKKIYNALKDDGIFFVGNTEQIIAPKSFGFSPFRTFFYKKVKEL